MNATIDGEGPGEDQVRVSVVHTWGGWPWRAECEVCPARSPGQRTSDEARQWAESHFHAFHEIG